MVNVYSPLGPFVPAPPEVAMQMLRDQGGPSPFEGGRNGPSGPSPLIALPPRLRQDPRRLRRSGFSLFNIAHHCGLFKFNDELISERVVLHMSVCRTSLEY